MARRTKAQIQRERLVDEASQNACRGLSIPVFKLKSVSDAAEAAYDAGKSEDEVRQAARAAAELAAA